MADISVSSGAAWPKKLYGKLSLDRAQFSIRLIRLLPGSFDDPIRCKLFRKTLCGSPPFEALSYTWGDSTDRRPATVNGIEISITKNLAEALRNLRHAEKERIMWADALCINQKDIPERNS